jgi:hypothetical protein
MFSNDLVGRVALNALRTFVPKHNGPLGIKHHERIIGGPVNERPKTSFDLSKDRFDAAPLGDVAVSVDKLRLHVLYNLNSHCTAIFYGRTLRYDYATLVIDRCALDHQCKSLRHPGNYAEFATKVGLSGMVKTHYESGYCRATMTARGEILGRGIFEIFPNDPQADGVSQLAICRIISFVRSGPDSASYGLVGNWLDAAGFLAQAFVQQVKELSGSNWFLHGSRGAKFLRHIQEVNVSGAAAARDCHDLGVRSPATHLQDHSYSLHVGHDDVGDHQIELALRELRQSFKTICGRDNRMALGFYRKL